jgi:hypothetical protein
MRLTVFSFDLRKLHISEIVECAFETIISPANCSSTPFHDCLYSSRWTLVEPEEVENRRRVYNAIPISAIDRSTLGTLVNEISQRLAADRAIGTD